MQHTSISSLFRILFLISLCQNLSGEILPQRSKRALWNFHQVVQCATGRSGLDFIDYGCWCGFGGKGTPVDGIDGCCNSHDMCYRSAQDNGACSYFSKYTSDYNWHCEALNSTALATMDLSYMIRMAYTYARPYNRLKGIPICTATNSVCGRSLCQCDINAALCFSIYPYHNKPKCP